MSPYISEALGCLSRVARQFSVSPLRNLESSGLSVSQGVLYLISQAAMRAAVSGSDVVLQQCSKGQLELPVSAQLVAADGS
jgi:hypothetical protein